MLTIGLLVACLGFAPLLIVTLAQLIPRLLRPSEAALEVSRLLRSDPSGWRVGPQTMQHLGSQISIWHANDDYGLTYWVGSPDDYGKYRKEHFRPADRLCVWRAVKDMMGGRASDIVSRAKASTNRAPLYMVPLSSPEREPMRRV